MGTQWVVARPPKVHARSRVRTTSAGSERGGGGDVRWGARRGPAGGAGRRALRATAGGAKGRGGRSVAQPGRRGRRGPGASRQLGRGPRLGASEGASGTADLVLPTPEKMEVG